MWSYDYNTHFIPKMEPLFVVTVSFLEDVPLDYGKWLWEFPIQPQEQLESCSNPEQKISNIFWTQMSLVVGYIPVVLWMLGETSKRNVAFLQQTFRLVSIGIGRQNRWACRSGHHFAGHRLLPRIKSLGDDVTPCLPMARRPSVWMWKHLPFSKANWMSAS